MSADVLVAFVIVLPLLLVSLVVHELAHGWVATRLGDTTAPLGRLWVMRPMATMHLLMVQFLAGVMCVIIWTFGFCQVPF